MLKGGMCVCVRCVWCQSRLRQLGCHGCAACNPFNITVFKRVMPANQASHGEGVWGWGWQDEVVYAFNGRFEVMLGEANRRDPMAFCPSGAERPTRECAESCNQNKHAKTAMQARLQNPEGIQSGTRCQGIRNH